MIRSAAVLGAAFALTATPQGCSPDSAGGPAPSSTRGALFASGPISLSSTAVFFGAPGLARTIAVRDPNYRGTFTVSGCSGVASYGSVENGELTVTAVAANTCTLTIRDAADHEASIAVTVTTLNAQSL
jgi:hypothetical protein